MGLVIRLDELSYPECEPPRLRSVVALSVLAVAAFTAAVCCAFGSGGAARIGPLWRAVIGLGLGLAAALGGLISFYFVLVWKGLLGFAALWHGPKVIARLGVALCAISLSAPFVAAFVGAMGGDFGRLAGPSAVFPAFLAFWLYYLWTQSPERAERARAHQVFGNEMPERQTVRALRWETVDLFADLVDPYSPLLTLRDDRGQTALHLAIMRSLSETALLLIKKGAPLNARDDDGVTPLDRARLFELTDVARALEDGGAKPGVTGAA